ncbi:MAG TPA: B12-binding domain-containing protein [Hyphomicrobiaceae bacterium]|nr:B12-binding domain-containing protein [Hyphomicrobiaceae bacterium]
MVTLTRWNGPSSGCREESRPGDGTRPDIRGSLQTRLSSPRDTIVQEMLLRCAIETEIAPRLMLLTRQQAAQLGERASGRITIIDEDVATLCTALLDSDTARVAELVDAFLVQGASVAQVLLELFAPAARRLGELWESDERTFAEVTMAMGELQRAMHHLDEASGRSARQGTLKGRSILLVPAAGEQHTFPLSILDAFFTMAGWIVEAHFELKIGAVCARLRRHATDVVGMSISRESLLGQAASDIDRMRQASINPRLQVLVGGRALETDPNVVARLGADGSASDARSALLAAERLVAG